MMIGSEEGNEDQGWYAANAEDETNLVKNFAADSIQNAFRRYKECKPAVRLRRMSSTENLVMNMAAETITAAFRINAIKKRKLRHPLIPQGIASSTESTEPDLKESSIDPSSLVFFFNHLSVSDKNSPSWKHDSRIYCVVKLNDWQYKTPSSKCTQDSAYWSSLSLRIPVVTNIWKKKERMSSVPPLQLVVEVIQESTFTADIFMASAAIELNPLFADGAAIGLSEDSIGITKVIQMSLFNKKVASSPMVGAAFNLSLEEGVGQEPNYVNRFSDEAVLETPNVSALPDKMTPMSTLQKSPPPTLRDVTSPELMDSQDGDANNNRTNSWSGLSSPGSPELLVMRNSETPSPLQDSPSPMQQKKQQQQQQQKERQQQQQHQQQQHPAPPSQPIATGTPPVVKKAPPAPSRFNGSSSHDSTHINNEYDNLTTDATSSLVQNPLLAAPLSSSASPPRSGRPPVHTKSSPEKERKSWAVPPSTASGHFPVPAPAVVDVSAARSSQQHQQAEEEQQAEVSRSGYNTARSVGSRASERSNLTGNSRSEAGSSSASRHNNNNNSNSNSNNNDRYKPQRRQQQQREEEDDALPEIMMPPREIVIDQHSLVVDAALLMARQEKLASVRLSLGELATVLDALDFVLDDKFASFINDEEENSNGNDSSSQMRSGSDNNNHKVSSDERHRISSTFLDIPLRSAAAFATSVAQVVKQEGMILNNNAGGISVADAAAASGAEGGTVDFWLSEAMTEKVISQLTGLICGPHDTIRLKLLYNCDSGALRRLRRQQLEARQAAASSMRRKSASIGFSASGAAAVDIRTAASDSNNSSTPNANESSNGTVCRPNKWSPETVLALTKVLGLPVARFGDCDGDTFIHIDSSRALRREYGVKPSILQARFSLYQRAIELINMWWDYGVRPTDLLSAHGKNFMTAQHYLNDINHQQHRGSSGVIHRRNNNNNNNSMRSNPRLARSGSNGGGASVSSRAGVGTASGRIVHCKWGCVEVPVQQQHQQQQRGNNKIMVEIADLSVVLPGLAALNRAYGWLIPPEHLSMLATKVAGGKGYLIRNFQQFVANPQDDSCYEHSAASVSNGGGGGGGLPSAVSGVVGEGSIHSNNDNNSNSSNSAGGGSGIIAPKGGHWVNLTMDPYGLQFNKDEWVAMFQLAELQSITQKCFVNSMGTSGKSVVNFAVLVPTQCLRAVYLSGGGSAAAAIGGGGGGGSLIDADDIKVGDKVRIVHITALRRLVQQYEWWDRPSLQTLTDMAGGIGEVVSLVPTNSLGASAGGAAAAASVNPNASTTSFLSVGGSVGGDKALSSGKLDRYEQQTPGVLRVGIQMMHSLVCDALPIEALRACSVADLEAEAEADVQTAITSSVVFGNTDRYQQQPQAAAPPPAPSTVSLAEIKRARKTSLFKAFNEARNINNSNSGTKSGGGAAANGGSKRRKSSAAGGQKRRSSSGGGATAAASSSSNGRRGSKGVVGTGTVSAAGATHTRISVKRTGSKKGLEEDAVNAAISAAAASSSKHMVPSNIVIDEIEEGSVGLELDEDHPKQLHRRRQGQGPPTTQTAGDISRDPTVNQQQKQRSGGGGGVGGGGVRRAVTAASVHYGSRREKKEEGEEEDEQGELATVSQISPLSNVSAPVSVKHVPLKQVVEVRTDNSRNGDGSDGNGAFDFAAPGGGDECAAAPLQVVEPKLKSGRKPKQSSSSKKSQQQQRQQQQQKEEEEEDVLEPLRYSWMKPLHRGEFNFEPLSEQQLHDEKGQGRSSSPRRSLSPTAQHKRNEEALAAVEAAKQAINNYPAPASLHIVEAFFNEKDAIINDGVHNGGNNRQKFVPDPSHRPNAGPVQQQQSQKAISPHNIGPKKAGSFKRDVHTPARTHNSANNNAAAADDDDGDDDDEPAGTSEDLFGGGPGAGDESAPPPTQEDDEEVKVTDKEGGRGRGGEGGKKPVKLSMYGGPGSIPRNGSAAYELEEDLPLGKERVFVEVAKGKGESKSNKKSRPESAPSTSSSKKTAKPKSKIINSNNAADDPLPAVADDAEFSLMGATAKVSTGRPSTVDYLRQQAAAVPAPSPLGTVESPVGGFTETSTKAATAKLPPHKAQLAKFFQYSERAVLKQQAVPDGGGMIYSAGDASSRDGEQQHGLLGADFVMGASKAPLGSPGDRHKSPTKVPPPPVPQVREVTAREINPKNNHGKHVRPGHGAAAAAAADSAAPLPPHKAALKSLFEFSERTQKPIPVGPASPPKKKSPRDKDISFSVQVESKQEKEKERKVHREKKEREEELRHRAYTTSQKEADYKEAALLKQLKKLGING